MRTLSRPVGRPGGFSAWAVCRSRQTAGGYPVAVCGAVAVCFDALYISMVSATGLFRRFVAYAV